MHQFVAAEVTIKVAEDGTFTVTETHREGTYYRASTWYKVRQIHTDGNYIRFTTEASS